jgi:hypothetical protein
LTGDGNLSSLRVSQCALDGTREKRVDAAGKEPTTAAAMKDEDERTDQTATKLVQMFQEGHLSAEFFFASASCR